MTTNFFKLETGTGFIKGEGVIGLIALESGIPPTVPQAPTISTATGGNASASVTFAARGNGGSVITSFTATSTPGSITGSGASSPVTVNGLTNGTAYTFTVTATNAVGTSGASSASNAVTPATVPAAPTIGTATSGNATASVTFTANGNGGSAITGFTVTSSPGGLTGSGASSPISVNGLTNGTAYTFTVAATNVLGTGASSAGSNSVTPSTVPAAPTIGIATAGNANASVAFTANSNGGSTITGFTATSSPGGITGSGASSPITVSGLTNGTSYTFTVIATNANGNSTTSGSSNNVTPTASSNLVMYSNGTLNAPWSVAQDLSFHGPFPTAWSSVTAYTVPTLVSISGVSGQVYRCISGNTNNTPPNATFWLPVSYPDNYVDATVVQGGHTLALSLTGQYAGWQQASNWPRPDLGGNNGQDISAYTQFQFDYWQPSSNSWNGVRFFYNRSLGNDIGENAIVTGTALTNIVGALTNGSWNTNKKVPLCFMGGLSKYNYYKMSVQQALAGQTPVYLDNVQWIPGTVSWIYRGNTTLESGWSDTSSNATITYNYLATNINANFYSLNEPWVPMATFTGVMTAGGALTVSSITNTIFIGMSVVGAVVPANCQITAGSGTSWTVSPAANISSASMSCGFLQSQVGIVRWVPSATSSFWQTSFSGGISTTGLTNYTVALLPTQAGYTYTCQAINTSGALIGSPATLSGFTPADNGVSTSYWTIYSVPLSTLGISNTTIGGMRITDTSGHTATIYACADGFWS